MNFEEYAAKPLLAAQGISVPKSELASTPAEARAAAERIGPCVVKAQVPTGKRGKAGGIKLAATPQEAEAHARNILGMDIAGWTVEKLLIEAQAPIARELYAAVLNDPDTKGPLILFSPDGGMDIEEIAEKHPERLARIPVDIRKGIDPAVLQAAIRATGEEKAEAKIQDVLARLYEGYLANDAELLEINPLVELKDGSLVALDCKFVLDDSAIKRRQELAARGTPDKLTGMEAEAAGLNLKYIDLEGSVGVIANGAGLTMTTMDAVRHYGGSPANFLEIGGEAYTLAKPALTLLLSNPNIKSLLVNFCGAFARTDVMTDGIVAAWQELKPDLPVFFSIHGTGDVEAIAMVRERLGMEPFERMDDAVKAAVEAAR